MSCDVLEQTSFTKNKLSLLIRIDNFPAFVSSKADCHTRAITINNVRWFIALNFAKFYQTSGKYDLIKQESDKAEILTAFLIGVGAGRSVNKDCTFDVEATFKFQNRPWIDQKTINNKFYFSAKNEYQARALLELARIEVNFIIIFFLSFCASKNLHLGLVEPSEKLFVWKFL